MFCCNSIIKTSLVFVLSILFYSCEKKASADFETDKTEYMAGEIVKLTNKSTSGSSFQWILANGQTSTEKNTEFIINPNLGFDEVSITLIAKSNSYCKRNSLTKKIKVIPKSYFTLSSIVPLYTETRILGAYSTSNASNFVVNSFYYIDPETFYFLNFYFPAGSSPSTGTYALQNSSSSLAPYNAFVKLAATDFVSGQLIVDYVNDKLHISFMNITDSTGNYKLSGEIYKP